MLIMVDVWLVYSGYKLCTQCIYSRFAEAEVNISILMRDVYHYLLIHFIDGLIYSPVVGSYSTSNFRTLKTNFIEEMKLFLDVSTYKVHSMHAEHVKDIKMFF